MLKRTLDIGLSLIALITFLPIMLLVAFLVAIFIGYPIIFTQIRPGLHGKPFKIYKFRTMKDLYDDDENPLPDHERITKLGQILRASSLDELPNLWAILKGDMSIVGPRPLLMDYLQLYNAEQAKRHDIKPGLTGWAQINGRNAISWEEKFKLDIWYVENQSFWLDSKIIFLTIKKVFQRSGISANGNATMPKFTGSKK